VGEYNKCTLAIVPAPSKGRVNVPVSVKEPKHLWLLDKEQNPWRHSKGSVLPDEIIESEKRLRAEQSAGKINLTSSFSCDCKWRSVPETLAFLEVHDIGVAETATHVLDNSFAEQRRGFGPNKRFTHRTLAELCIGTEITYEAFMNRIKGSPDYDLVMPHQVDMMALPRGAGLFVTDEPAEHYYIAMRPVDINDNGVKRSSILIASGNGPQLRTDEMKGLIPLNTTLILAHA
jgi:hypothetical protein